MNNDLDYTNQKGIKRKKQSLRNKEYYIGQNAHDRLFSKSKEGKVFRNLLRTITSQENILLAYRNIKNNYGSKTPGTDLKTIETFKSISSKDYVDMVTNSLKDYKPGKIRRVYIPKANGKKRPLGIPNMKDRLIQQSIKQVIEPICEAKFHPHSYGFRPNRSASHALARCFSLIHTANMHYVVDIDIKSFFDNVNHTKLLKQLWTIGIRDKNLLCILGKMLKAEIIGIGTPKMGTPQGGILSPLLANVVLNEFDWWISDQWETFKLMGRNGIKPKTNSNPTKARELLKLSKADLKQMFIVRYADDFKIFCRDSKTAFKIFNAAKSWLKERLGLEISQEKSKVTNLRKNYTQFLGIKFRVKPKKKKFVERSHIADDRKSKILEQLKKQIRDIKHDPTAHSVRRLNAKILGIHNYYKMASRVVKDMNKIDYLCLAALKKLKPSNKGKHSESYLRLYGRYVKRKVMKVNEVDIYPIYGVTNKPPMGFDQNICDYTQKGRNIIHKKLNSSYNYVFMKLVVSAYRNEFCNEFNDNRLAKFAGQNGKCAVTGYPLGVDNKHCHHINRKCDGGKDVYDNLIWVINDIHILIHSTSEEIIKTYIKGSKFTSKQLKKLNSFRKVIGNPEIRLT